jgi:O-antigen/teichoic acid export membrane protein
MVFAKFGVWSFVAGNVVGAVVSAGISLRLVKYRPRIAFDRVLSRQLLSFGMFFQFETLTNEAAGWIIPLISGTRLGPSAVGLLTWASSNGRRPLMIVDNVMKVAFPHFSRLQHDPEELGRQMGLYLRRLTFFCYSWGLLGLLLAEPMTKIVYTAKWLPGLLCLQLFALGLIADVANWVGGMTLTAIGGVKQTVKWTLTKSILSIVGALLMVGPMGIVGIPLASFLASVISGGGILIDLRKRIPVDFSHLWKPAIPIVIIGMFYLPFVAADSLQQFPRPIGSQALNGAVQGILHWKDAVRWVLGVVIVAWSVRWALREFRPGRPRVATA